MVSQPASKSYDTDDPNDKKWTTAAFKALMAGTMTAEVTGVSGAQRVTVDGKCPRCKHELRFGQLLDAVAGENGPLAVQAFRVDAAAPTYMNIVVSCCCTEAHANRPTGVTSGCGINFRIKMLRPAALELL